MKMMISFRDDVAEELKLLAEQRYITVQDLLRAVIIPEWKKMNGNVTRK